MPSLWIVRLSTYLDRSRASISCCKLARAWLQRCTAGADERQGLWLEDNHHGDAYGRVGRGFNHHFLSLQTSPRWLMLLRLLF